MIPDALVALCYLSTLSWPFCGALVTFTLMLLKLYRDVLQLPTFALYAGATFAYLCLCIEMLQLPIFALYTGATFAYFCFVCRSHFCLPLLCTTDLFEVQEIGA